MSSLFTGKFLNISLRCCNLFGMSELHCDVDCHTVQASQAIRLRLSVVDV